MNWTQILRYSRYGGVAGAVFGIIFGMFLLAYMFWLEPRSRGGPTSPDVEIVYTAFALISLGIGVLFARFPLWTSHILMTIRKWEREKYITIGDANAFVGILLWQMSGDDVKLPDFFFQRFIEWLKSDDKMKRLKEAEISCLQEKWRRFRTSTMNRR
ncbi:MAG: hypothetical protein ABFE13_20490 [Phycisphaerales bacterium]